MSAPVSLPAGAAKFHPFVVGDQRSFWLACLHLWFYGTINTMCSKSLIEESKTLKGPGGDVSWHL